MRVRNSKGQFDRSPIECDGKKWCNCKEPNVVSAKDEIHQGYCLNCHCNWYN